MKKKVAVIYGGNSGEHEVSLQSAASVIQHLDREKFEIIPISIDKTGRWQWNDLKLIEQNRGKALPIFANAPEMRLVPHGQGKAHLESSSGKGFQDIDVVFPVMHGPLCEDGSIQGLLELANVAYVGSGVLGSAIGMDKDIAKRLAQYAGIPVAPFVAVKKGANLQEAEARARKELPLPVFVKPANMGSSVGVHKIKRWEDLAAALKDSFQYDSKVLIEQGIDAREVEVAVLDGNPIFTSVASEIVPSKKHEFYSYDAKYLDQDGASVELPAKLSPQEMQEVQRLAALAFQTLECNGMARVDFFLERGTNKFYFNEVNTIPGFTSISMYPKMMEASGIPYKELLTRLVNLALERQEKRVQLRRTK